MSWYRNPKILSAIIFLLLILIVWFAGPMMGLVSPESRFALIFLIMLVWVIILMVGKLLREQSAGVLEKMLRRKADDAVVSATPESRAEVALLRQRLLQAIETLKTSNIGKTRGKAALYELPWYMIVGHPSAGKSCAIINSGLTFPLAAKGSVSVQGIGGTRNCDWFFSTEGVLLDTAGRYSTQTEDRLEWMEFLKLLKKHRPKSPLNGILVALSLPELLQHQSDAFALYARQIRQRINEVDDLFGTKIPVYLVFTKLDLLRGFSQFFEDLSEEERRQVWGATMSHEQAEEFDAVNAVAHHFEVLFQGLTQVGTDKLASNRANQRRPALFAFPLEFHGLKDALCKFTEHLVENDPYHTKPLIRGFYFTSALQENAQSVTTGHRVSGLFDLSKFGFKPSELTSSQPYFLESLFRKVVFPDMFLVGRSTSPKRNRLRLASLGAGIFVLAVLAGCWTWSFVGNQKLIATAQSELVEYRKLTRSERPIDRLQALQVLQFRLEQLYQYRQEGPPWKIGWGLYRGNDVEKALRRDYFDGLRQVMLEPIKQKLEERLATTMVTSSGTSTVLTINPAPSSGTTVLNVSATANKRTEETYNMLKTYLMLATPERMDASHLEDQMPLLWRPWLEANCSGADFIRLAERALAFYIGQLKEPDLPLIQNQEKLVAEARSRVQGEVNRLPPLERIYSEIKAQGNTTYLGVTVASILSNGKDTELLGTSAMVSGSFTREAWTGYIAESLELASKGQFKGTDWVLGNSLQDDPGQTRTEEEQVDRYNRLLALYQADYIKEWENFLQGIVVHPYGSLDRAAAAMSRFGDPLNSPIKLILIKVAHETAWDNPSEVNKALKKIGKTISEKTITLLSQGTRSSQSGPSFGTVGGRFAPLAELVTSQNAQGGPMRLDAYLESLLKLRGKYSSLATSGDPGLGARALVQATLAGAGSELSEALQVVDTSMLGRMEEGPKNTLRPLLVRPLVESFAALSGPTEQLLNTLWQQQVYSQWTNLAAKYPFDDSSNEAPWSDITKFLQPGEGTLPKFVEKELGNIVLKRGDAYVAGTWAGKGVGLSPNFLNSISRLISSGAVLQGDSKFEVQPVPIHGITEVLLEIDGQKIAYQMGPQAWTTMGWPGQTGAQGARLQATSWIGATVQIHNFPGRLGLLRLFDQARIENPKGPVSALDWRFKVSSSFTTRTPPTGALRGEEFFPQGIRFNFRMVSGVNPLQLRDLRDQSLPQRVSN